MYDVCLICILFYRALYGVEGNLRKQHTYLVCVAKSKLRSIERNSILLDQEVHVCGIYSG